MRQAIQTKYLGPTNHRGGRIKATCEAGSVTISWDHALGPVENHTAACTALVEKLGWDGNGHGGEWVAGCLPSWGYAFVWAPYLEGK